MEVNFKFTGRETAKIAAVMAALGMVETITAEVEQPKPKAKRQRKPKAEPVASEPVAPKPDDTRLDSKETTNDKPKRSYRRKSNKGPKEVFKIEDCLFLGMFVASTGRECAVAAVSKGDDPSKEKQFGKYRLAFIDKDFKTATTDIQWFVEKDDVLNQREATFANAKSIKTLYN